MQFLVCNRDTVKHMDPEITHVIISITDPNSEDAVLNTNKNCLGVLRLSFHDIDFHLADKKGFKFQLFTRQQAREILDFVDKYQPVLVIAQCEAGISRSAGVCASLSQIYVGHDNGFFRTHIPNMLVYRTILWEHEGFNIDQMFKG